MNRVSKVFKFRFRSLLGQHQGQSKDPLLQRSTVNLFGLQNILKNYIIALLRWYRANIVSKVSPAK
jgi:hypothetical protein